MLPQRQETVRCFKCVEGHVRGVTRIVEGDKYCIDVIRQIMAIKGALHKLICKNAWPLSLTVTMK